jgi:S1-C subfamily serine protease
MPASNYWAGMLSLNVNCFGGVMKGKLLIPILILMLATLACNLTGGKSPTDVPDQPTTAPAVETPVVVEPEDTPEPVSDAVDNIDDVQGAVFQIIGTGTINDVERGKILNAEWGGTGFFIDSSGIGVTNNHVVAGAALLKAYVNGEREPRTIRVLGTSECADLAVVQVEGDDFPYLEWYDGTVKTGLDVYAAGFPLVEPEYNLTKGIVSKTNADGQTYWSSLSYIYGHDAKINGGNSGGPLVTTEGKVVGVNYMSRASVDQQFAIPTDLAIPIVNKLKNKQNIASLGMSGSAIVFGPNGEYPGIWVESTTTGGIADKAGIEPGDIIHEVEDILVALDGTMKEYCDILRGHDTTDPLKVMVYRYGTDEILEGTLNSGELKATGYAGLSGYVADDTTTTTGASEAFRLEEFDEYSDWWTWFLTYGDETFTDIYFDEGRLKFDLTDGSSDTYAYLIYEEYIYEDVYLHALVENRGKNTNSVSLICRYDDVKGWYEVNIGSDGLYNIFRFDGNLDKGDGYKMLTSGGSTRIRTGKEYNEYTFSCKGNTLTLWINGTQTNTIRDNSFREGMIGIGVSSYGVAPINVEFESLEIGVP